MESRKLKDENIKQAKALWKQAFGDSDAYIDFNFQKNLDLEYSLGIFDSERLVCMLFMLSKKLIFREKDMDTFFIAGVATDDEYRYKGLARRIMGEAKETLRNKGVTLVYLYPFNHNFYRKMDYHTVSWMRKIEFEKNENQSSELKANWYSSNDRIDVKTLVDLYNMQAETKESYFDRKEKAYKLMLETMSMDDGRIVIFMREERPVGYVLYYIEEEKFNCLESVFLNKKTAESAIDEISKKYKGFLYIDDKFDIPGSAREEYAMMQIIDSSKARNFFEVKNDDEVFKREIMILEQY